ncbi:type IX secretion system membrane protein PorP/SprF [Pseudozobellia sp. WGM2]|uniref:PorP/SprF family type IX secretion system membrane protein n=1 Tax=Pseudozobellia sp. WGM2 TaxID=2787625 RepID=UPI001ADF7879|nr:type IX secretion system membrane protein PorP/SprF [Pseudozobellia sp. WGM2]
MQKYILIGLLILAGLPAMAQQDAQYTQYMYNTMSVNPAYAGSRGVMSLTGLHRSQWVGLEGAPRTQTFAVHSPAGKNVGLGLSIVNDDIGPTKETYFDVLFSYTLRMSGDRKLSFGLNAAANLLDVDFAQLRQFVPQLTSAENIDNKFSPNFGAGIYYHTGKFYLGASVPNFLETKHFDESSDSDDSSSFLARERINYYLITGYVFDLAPQWELKPALLTKMVSGAPLQVDVSANFRYRQKLTLGAAYRWSAAWSAMAAFQISDPILLGLAYDRETTELGNTSFNNGSFEVLLRVELFNRKEKVIYPRFF